MLIYYHFSTVLLPLIGCLRHPQAFTITKQIYNGYMWDMIYVHPRMFMYHSAFGLMVHEHSLGCTYLHVPHIPIVYLLNIHTYTFMIMHYRHWLNNHDAKCVHMPGTHFTAGWMGGPFLPVTMAGLKLATLSLGYLLVIFHLVIVSISDWTR